MPLETFAASDWNLRPEHPHWPLVWLTLLSQLAVGVSVTASSFADHLAAAGLAGAAMAGALFHLGRPAVAWKAFRNLRRSWLSREVALLSGYAALAAGAIVLRPVGIAAAVVGIAGIYASARLYIVPGRPAWNTQLTVVRFFAAAVALGAPITGHLEVSVAGTAVSLAATAVNWLRLRRIDRPPYRGAVQLELGWFGVATAIRFLVGIGAIAAALGGLTALAVVALVAVSELLGRWLFYVCVVPLNMPGSFWRGAAGSHR